MEGIKRNKSISRPILTKSELFSLSDCEGPPLLEDMVFIRIILIFNQENLPDRSSKQATQPVDNIPNNSMDACDLNQKRRRSTKSADSSLNNLVNAEEPVRKKKRKKAVVKKRKGCGENPTPAHRKSAPAIGRSLESYYVNGVFQGIQD
jgi:hypothetical protein